MSKYILVTDKNLKKEDSKKWEKAKEKVKDPEEMTGKTVHLVAWEAQETVSIPEYATVNILSTKSTFSGLCGLCCHPCQFGSVASKLDESYLLWFIIGCCAPCIPAFMLRGKVRDR